MKTLTFALMHFSIAFSVVYLMTGSITIGGLVAIVEPAINTVGYHFHEKIWAALQRRRDGQPEQQAQPAGFFRTTGHLHA